jgi:acyl-coenzyme A synthetase/AMP-(fatty) acid ligase
LKEIDVQSLRTALSAGEPQKEETDHVVKAEDGASPMPIVNTISAEPKK